MCPRFRRCYHVGVVLLEVGGNVLFGGNYFGGGGNTASQPPKGQVMGSSPGRV
ncbi:unnamed protein product [Ectocarpus sp. CCAP 1310/34]|nr:unnamed protein product [Ectocarpus sp. CCAP 1310/34]